MGPCLRRDDSECVGTQSQTIHRSALATRISTSRATACNTSRQSCVRCLRNSFSVGNHGVCSPVAIQRQSGSGLSKTHAGNPSAPARLAIEVSEVMTRSMQAMTAAVSMKPSLPELSSCSMDIPAGRESSCSSPKFFCRLINRTPEVCHSATDLIVGLSQTPTDADRSGTGSCQSRRWSPGKRNKSERAHVCPRPNPCRNAVGLSTVRAATVRTAIAAHVDGLQSLTRGIC
jgi:hypothetical protein